MIMGCLWIRLTVTSSLQHKTEVVWSD